MSSEPTRVVLVGCGGICKAWLGVCAERKDVEIAGLVDIKEEQTRVTAEKFGLSKAARGTNLAEMLDAVKPDAVFDCTVPEAHMLVTVTALEHGCHVLGEKPLADTMDNARRMVDAAKAADRVYAVMQNRRYTPSIQALKAFLDSGAIGRVETVHSDFFIGAHFGGFRDEMLHVLLLDMAIHTFDAARYITGADPRSALCHEWNPPRSWYRHGASAIAVFEMSDGMVYSYRGSWCAEGLNTTWEADWRIIGSKGTVTWDGATGFRAEEVTGSEGFMRERRALEVQVPDAAGRPLGHAGGIDEFLRCIREGGAPQTVCTDNIKSLAMVHGAIDSATRAARVEIGV